MIGLSRGEASGLKNKGSAASNESKDQVLHNLRAKDLRAPHLVPKGGGGECGRKPWWAGNCSSQKREKSARHRTGKTTLRDLNGEVSGFFRRNSYLFHYWVSQALSFCGLISGHLGYRGTGDDDSWQTGCFRRALWNLMLAFECPAAAMKGGRRRLTMGWEPLSGRRS